MKTYDQLINEFNSLNTPEYGEPNENQLNLFEQKFVNYFLEGNNCIKTIVGIDIYKYSSYSEKKQAMIPFLFDILKLRSIECCMSEKYIFNKIDFENIKKMFIHTGDGGFQLFDNPIHALFFISYMNSFIWAFNSFKFLPILRKYIGPLSVRFAVTKSNVYFYENNIFGDGIISNARILSKDKLNRCLIDENIYRWFEKHINGIETLENLNLKDLSTIDSYKNIINEDFDSEDNVLIDKESSRISSIICSKIGKIRSKDLSIEIYNLFYKVSLSFTPLPEDTIKKLVIPIGNINNDGLSNED